MSTFKNKINLLNLQTCRIIANGFTGNTENITFDSRKIPPNSIFFALEGTKKNGHQFTVEALNKGANVAIVKKTLPEYKNCTNKTIIEVDSPVQFMANLAREYRKYIKTDVIGITGTIGKTTTKYLLGQVLSKKFKTLVAPESYNNLLGLSYTILNYNDEDKVILELGINHTGEMDELMEIARPDIAIITYISPVHLEGMKSIFNIFNEKKKITKYAKKVFINSDSFLLHTLTHELANRPIYIGCHSCDSDYKATLVQQTLDKTTFTINNEFFEIPTYSKTILYPALFSYALSKEFDITYEQIYNAFLNFTPTKLRGELIKKGDRIILVDCYNASPQSMLTAIEQFTFFTSEQTSLTSCSNVFILGDMLELGEYSAFYHRKIANFLKSFSGLKILIGKEFKSGSDFLKDFNVEHYYFPSVDELINSISKIIEPKHKLVLLKASRKLQLEKLIEFL